MRSLWMTLGILSLQAARAAEGAPPEAPASIAAVTVYSDRARVTRRAGGLALPAGKSAFRVAGLPDGLLDDSVRVAFPSDPSLRVLSVEVARRFEDRFTTEEAKQREEAVKRLEEEGRLLASRESALAREAELLKTLTVGAQPNPGQEPQTKPLAPEAWGKVLDAVGKGLAENARARLETAQARRAWQRRLDQARQALTEVQAYHRKSEKVVTVSVDAGAGKPAAALELSYLIPGARWTPSYDVRVLPEAGQIEVARYALVQQRTGEDWTGASLVCSTAVPAISATIPELMAWTIGEAPRPQISFAGRAGEDKRREEAAKDIEIRDHYETDDGEGEVSGYANLFETERMPMVRGKGHGGGGRRRNLDPWGDQAGWIPPCVLAGGYDYAFPALKPETVKSDGQASRIALGTDRFPAALRYEAAPLASPHVFLACDLKNDSTAPYLGGQANIFLAGDFLGMAPLKTLAVGETAAVPLGIDEKIKVVRKEREVKGAAGLFRNKERTVAEVEISATSYLKKPVHLRLLDRAPFSFQDDIQAAIEDARPAPTEATKKGLLVWDLQLAPGRPMALAFRYAVRTPEDFDLTRTPDMEGAR